MFFRTLVLLSLCLAVLGCTPQPTDDRVEVTFWTISLSPTYDDYIKGLIKSYEAENPGVRLKWVDLPQSASRQKLMAGIAAGKPPDLVNTSTDFALTLAQNSAISSLNERVSEEERNRYFPNLWSAVTHDDEVFAVPWYVTTKVLIYNKELLKEAGLNPEAPPSTTAELDAFARAVKAKTDAVGLMPSIRIWNDWSMEGTPFVDQEALRPLFTAPESVAVLERYSKLYAEGVMPPETLTEGYRGALDRYKAGSLAFLEAGPQLLLRIKADAPEIYNATGISPMPKSKTETVPASTMNFVVPRSSKHREEAIKLALFLTSPEAQLEFCKLVPILPSTTETAVDPYFEEGGGDPLQSLAVRISLKQLPRARDFSLILPRRKDLMRALKDAVEQSVRGEVPTDEALQRAAEEWDKTLAPFRKSSP